MTFVDLVAEDKVHVRVRAGWRLGASRDGSSFIALGPKGAGGGYLGRYAREFEAANTLLLNAGAPLGVLRDTVLEASGTDRAAGYVDWLQRLCARGLLEFPLVDAAGERAVVLPQWHTFVPAVGRCTPDPRARLDPFAYIRRDGDVWLLDSPLCGARFQLPDLASLDAPVVRGALDAAGFLESARNPHDPHCQALEQWEFHDLLFHVRHRKGWHRDPTGMTAPHIGEIEPLPAARPGWAGRRVPLPHAPKTLGGESLSSVLERRRSVRSHDEDHPISIRDLGILLDRAARIRGSGTSPVYDFQGRSGWFEGARRTCPSGGACHELEIYPVVARCEGLGPGLYHYDAWGHALVRISERTPDTDRILIDASESAGGLAKPQVVLAITARFARVTWKYRSIAYGLILRNVGALYQTLYLVATELGLSPCALGSGDSALFSRVTGLDPVVEGTVGDFVLGGPPPPSCTSP